MTSLGEICPVGPARSGNSRLGLFIGVFGPDGARMPPAPRKDPDAPEAGPASIKTRPEARPISLNNSSAGVVQGLP